ncbi:MAG: PqqD family protein [Bacteroidaceae bacterium]|nr:PqqD family protein [Bacteroidaceae bacterium]MBR6845326.1 PqqD family protein [Bacteroidaceae bacterium]
MKIKEGFQLREVCGEYVVVAYGMKNIDFSKVINLNESAADMWKAVVGREFTVEDLKNALLDTYDVSEEQAFADAQRVAAEWKEIGLVS